MTRSRRALTAPFALLAVLLAISIPRLVCAQESPPLRQSSLTPETATVQLLTLRDASRNDRFIGLGVRDVRWAPDGSFVYFRWNRNPITDDDPGADPWFSVDRRGRNVGEVSDTEVDLIPGGSLSWSGDGRKATWVRDGSVYVYDAGRTGDEQIWRAVTLGDNARSARMTHSGDAVHFQAGERLYRYSVESGTVAVVAAKHELSRDRTTEAGEWLREQQLELIDFVRHQAERRDAAANRARREDTFAAQLIPVDSGVSLDNIQLSPDGRFVTFRARTPASSQPRTDYIDYVEESGYATVRRARPKVGEPRAITRLGVVQVDPTVHPDSVEVNWVDLDDAGDRRTAPHGPYWSLDGDRAIAQFISDDHKDLWFAELDLESGSTTVITHDHDDAWIGGPPVQANYLQPALLEWLPGGRFVFASERTGWSHLYLADPDGSIAALTSGNWEVRGASLSRDRSTWLLTTSREHPSDDHLYLLPAGGGQMERLTDKPGRHTGYWSPDGERLAVMYDESIQLPDLFLRDPSVGARETRITQSGSDAFFEHPLIRPAVVSFEHPDGDPVWAALFKADQPNPEQAAVIHVHGGGYRQFAHRGWTVYGYAPHLGMINYLVQQGYTVLDFDYRGSAGFGRDYRTDIARSMGIKDADGAAAAARFLASEHGIDPNRIGIYGVSYGGFMTLMSQFRYPGVFTAGVANAAVSDWAHYNDGWTSRILGVPYEDPEAFRISSPIYYAEGLEDNLLIVHGLVDNNVQFQDAARLVQRLIELEKEFEVMYYPVEPHRIQTEASRYDFVRRVVGYFDRHLRGW